MLKLGNIRVTINSFVILRGINLDIPAGELVALVGRNGAGKTTTLKSIMGLVPVSDGSIHLDGEDLMEVPPHRRASLGIGYMPEDRRLIGSLTVQDNNLMPAWASKLTIADERLDYIYHLMPDLAPFVKRRASMLSGTKILLLDEPFEGLSPGLGDKLGETIQQVQKDGLTVLLAESDLKRIGFAEKTYMIERGETVDGSES